MTPGIVSHNLLHVSLVSSFDFEFGDLSSWFDFLMISISNCWSWIFRFSSVYYFIQQSWQLWFLFWQYSTYRTYCIRLTAWVSSNTVLCTQNMWIKHIACYLWSRASFSYGWMYVSSYFLVRRVYLFSYAPCLESGYMIDVRGCLNPACPHNNNILICTLIVAFLFIASWRLKIFLLRVERNQMGEGGSEHQNF